MSEKEADGVDPLNWSAEARKHFEEGAQVFRLMGLDEDTIQSMEKAMAKLYNPATGDFQLDDFEQFKEALLPTLLESPVMEETLASTKLLEEPELKRLWFTRQQLQDCLDDWEEWLAELLEEHGDLSPAQLLLDDSIKNERGELGRILYQHYGALLDSTPDLEREIYDALFEISRASKGEKQELAKNAMTSFTLFPGRPNAFLQFLFAKSILHNGELIADASGVIADPQELRDFTETMEDAVFSILCEGEGDVWDEDWDDEDDDDDDDDWDDEEDWEDEDGEGGLPF